MKTGAKLPQAAQRRGAFSLLEVMIAIMIFCMAAFTILCLVSSSLENTRRLQRPLVDAGVMASEYSLTNRLVEGSDSGDLADSLGDAYKGYTWSSNIQEVQSNKLFQVDLVLQSPDSGKPIVSKISILLYRPQSVAGSLDGATVAKK